jgi:hypothetical protein
MISNISVLNTIQDNALDVFVDADGFLNVTGCPKVKATNPKVNTIGWSSAIVGVTTVTFTPVNNYTYSFTVTGYDSSNNLITLPFSYTTAVTGATKLSICTAIAANITKSAIGAKFASVAVGGSSGSETLVLTGTALNPLISFNNFSGDTSMVVSAVGSGTTLGKEAIGYGADLLVAYGGFIGSSAIVPTGFYNQYEITVNPPIMFGGQSITEVGSTTYVVLINKDNTATAFVQSLLYGVDDLGVAKTMGTITGLAKGYRVVVQDSGSGTASIATTGIITLIGASFTTLATRPADILAISGTVKSTLASIASTTAATGDYVTLQAAAAFKTIGLRNIPN